MIRVFVTEHNAGQMPQVQTPALQSRLYLAYADAAIEEDPRSSRFQDVGITGAAAGEALEAKARGALRWLMRRTFHMAHSTIIGTVSVRRQRAREHELPA